MQIGATVRRMGGNGACSADVSSSAVSAVWRVVAVGWSTSVYFSRSRDAFACLPAQDPASLRGWPCWAGSVDRATVQRCAALFLSYAYLGCQHRPLWMAPPKSARRLTSPTADARLQLQGDVDASHLSGEVLVEESVLYGTGVGATCGDYHSVGWDTRCCE